MNSDPKTIEDWLYWGEKQLLNAGVFFGHGTDNPWDEALSLLLYTVGQSWDADESLLSELLTPQQQVQFRQLVGERIERRIPAAYLVREGWFAGMPFYVDERVLVPRSPLGELIQQAYEPWLQAPPRHILDLCTGSGCIGIATAHVFPDAEVLLSDISPDALAVAQRNIERYSLQQRVSCCESDGFAAIRGHHFDLIVSNPPYVDAEDLADMPTEYHHEPAIGLASGEDGLDFTRQLLAEAAEHLTESGILIVEVGNSWVALDELYPSVPFTWLAFEQGGHGVFMLTREQLLESQSAFNASWTP